MALAAAALSGGCVPGSFQWMKVQEVAAPTAHPDSTWTHVDSTDTYVHKHSGFAFPARLGAFTRDKTKIYDAAGDDVSVGYNDNTSGAWATIYVYPIPGDVRKDSVATWRAFEEHFHEMLSTVQENKTKPKMLSEEPYGISCAPGVIAGKKASFLFLEQGMEIESLLYVFPYQERYVKFRVSYPRAAAAQTAPVLSGFFQAFQWPEHVVTLR